jgi:RNA polymerase sigma factor (sigma-70 family)
MSSRDFTATYDRHVARVYGFFAYGVRSRADAEDLTQQTFERAMRAWGSYDGARASASTWLLAIARNLLIDHLRADRSRCTELIDDGGLETIAAPADRHSLGLDPDLERALAELNPRERELIALRFGGDLTGPEIAELTGLTSANVKQILSRSLRRMRASLDPVLIGAEA